MTKTTSDATVAVTLRRHDKLTVALISLALFLVSFVVYKISPIDQIADSNYSMLLSMNLYRHHTFVMDRYWNPPIDQTKYPSAYAVMKTGDHYYYVYPPGTPILSMPAVALMEHYGLSPAIDDRLYDRNGEVKIERWLAAFLTAAFVVIVFLTALTRLSLWLSIMLALSSAFATQAWSTASRAMWSHTWMMLLSAIAVWLLLRAAAAKKAPNPWLLATVVSWLYYVRPSASPTILAVSVYMLWCHRSRFIAFAVTGAAWLSLFLAFSQHYYHAWLPFYYRSMDQFSFHGYARALAGILWSPSRGLLVYLPWILVLAWVLIRYRRTLQERPLIAVALAAIAANVLLLAGFNFWYGGASFGPRYGTDFLPWWVLLAVVGLQARNAATQSGDRQSWLMAAENHAWIITLCLAVFIHGRGAWSEATWHDWGVVPIPVENDEARLWEWKRPQFMEGLTPYSRRIKSLAGSPGYVPAAAAKQGFPLVKTGARILMSDPDVDHFAFNFSAARDDGRWLFGPEARFNFVLDHYAVSVLHLRMYAFLAPGKLDSQRVELKLNNLPLGAFVLREPGMSRNYQIPIPAGNWRPENTLCFSFPDGRSQKQLGLSDDEKIHGVILEWLAILPEPPEAPAPVASAPKAGSSTASEPARNRP